MAREIVARMDVWYKNEYVDLHLTLVRNGDTWEILNFDLPYGSPMKTLPDAIEAWTVLFQSVIEDGKTVTITNPSSV